MRDCNKTCVPVNTHAGFFKSRVNAWNQCTASGAKNCIYVTKNNVEDQIISHMGERGNIKKIQQHVGGSRSRKDAGIPSIYKASAGRHPHATPSAIRTKQLNVRFSSDIMILFLGVILV